MLGPLLAKTLKQTFLIAAICVASNCNAAIKKHPHHIDKLEQQQFLSELQAIELAPKLILASDYVWRGVTQSNNSPAVQGNFLLHNKLGMYGGVFGTNTNYPGADDRTVTSEFQLYTGIKRQFACFDYDIGVRSYYIKCR